MAAGDEHIIEYLRDTEVRWVRARATVHESASDVTATERALDLHDALWGKTELSQRFRAFLQERGISIYDRTIKDHFTGSVIVLDPATRRILMTHHPRSHIWQQLGGHDEGEHDPLMVAAREAAEESGIDELWVCELPVRVDMNEAKGGCRTVPDSTCDHYDMCYLAIAGNPTFIRSEESNDMRWVSLDGLRAFVADGHAQQRVWDMACNAMRLFDCVSELGRLPVAS